MHLTEMIEILRAEMVELGMRLGFQDPAVLKASQNLDELIVQYYRMQYGAVLEGRQS